MSYIIKNLINSPRSLNVIASLGLKPKDLYKISFEEFLNQNPNLKKLNKDIQNQRYILYEEERENNIKKCIQKRQELIDITKKSKSKSKLNANNEYERNNSVDKLNIKKIHNPYAEKNRIYMTENSYMMNNSSGKQSLMTKDDLVKVTCLQKEKSKLEKKAEEKEDYLRRILRSELIQEKKMRKVKEKINEKEKKIKKFLKEKNEDMKLIKNERYQDHQDIYERQKLYEKMLLNYDQKISVTKKKQSQSNNKDKMEDLKEQIKDYERKNKEYKQKITEMFDLKDNSEEKKEDTKKVNLSNNSNMGRRKLIDMEEKFEMERFRRENALMSHMNQFQNKINGYLEKNEQKEKKIKKTMQNLEKIREEKRIIQSMHFDEIREKIKDNQKRLEKERKKKLENLEKKDLKDFAIKQEKIRMYEERKKMNQQNYEEREAMKAKLKEILKDKKDINNIDNENFISSIINN